MSDTVIPMPSVQRLGQHHRLAAAVATDGHAEPAAVAVDLGSGQTRLWAAGAGIRIAPGVGDALSRPTPLVRRGRIVDAAGCGSPLTLLLHTFSAGASGRARGVACRPALAAPADQDAIRRVVTAVFKPSRVLLIAELITRLDAKLRVRVRPASSPRLVALSGAGPAATVACPDPATAAT